MENITRRCSWCGSTVSYTTQKALQYAEKHSSKCPKCRRSGTKHSEETKKYLASLREGTHLNAATKQKIGDACRGEKSFWFGKCHSDESKEKMSRWHSGKTLTPDHIQKIANSNRGHRHTTRYKQKMSQYWKGRPVSDATKTKMRQAAIRRVIDQFGATSYNKDACIYIDNLNKEQGWNLQHAQNGGEVEVVGYLVDGYDKTRNIVFEYDEKQHFTFDGKLRNRDLKRQQIIMDHLKCDFYRYDAVNKVFYKVDDKLPLVS